MKMTKQKVAELLLNMNDDCSNVEIFDGGWRLSNRVLGDILFNISNGIVYRIKDNSVKEVTPALRGKWVKNKQHGYEEPIDHLDYNTQHIGVDGIVYSLENFNERWQLVED